MIKKLLHVIILVALLYPLSCKENVADRPFVNQAPKTFLWLYPDSTLGTGVSRQRIRWWGEDPDGVVSGFLFAFKVFPTPVTSIPTPDPFRYTWVVANDTLILFPLDTLFTKFTVAVRAVDNTFAGLPNQSTVRMSPSPFWDRNDNGVLDSIDVPLPGFSASADPVGAVQTFPIRNSPPTITIANNPYDASKTLKQPDTTFTVATFAFKGSDLDGDNTIARYRVALNDTANPSNWVTIPVRDTIVTLVVPRLRSDTATVSVEADIYGGNFLGRRLIGRIGGLRLDALNKFFVQVQDVAGEYSPVISFPTGTDSWYVKKPRAKILLISDYIRFDSTQAFVTYRNSVVSVGGQFSFVDRINMIQGLSLQERIDGYKLGSLVPPFIDPALIQTFLLFDYVLWYTDQFPSMWVAQLSIFPYLQNGGKVIFSTMFLNTADPRGALRDIAPIDSVGALLSPVVFARYKLLPDSTNLSNIYPLVALDTTQVRHSIFLRQIYRRSDAQYIYRLQADTLVPPRYAGSPNIAVVDGQRKIIFVGLPIHLLDNRTNGNPQGLDAFFAKIFSAFSLKQRVDRRKY